MKSVLFLIMLISKCAFAEPALYDCSSPRPEMAGFHNMILFGEPNDQLYAYHLPLFAGEVNGASGHVFMHVYQGLWKVSLDSEVKEKYSEKFEEKKNSKMKIPMFSFSPRGDTFKVPEAICDKGFETDAVVVYGHVESNPQFPAPELLSQKLAKVKMQETIFSRRFDGTAQENLTYILFGSKKQYYAAHYLTDDENSFDQILSVKIEDDKVKELIEQEGGAIVTIPIKLNPGLDAVKGAEGLKSKNNKFKLPIGQMVVFEFQTQELSLKVESQIYFNDNGDLQIFRK